MWCLECKCNETGSISKYCNEETGKCLCNTGFGGDKCELCATGYVNCMETDNAVDADYKLQCDVSKDYTRSPDIPYYQDKFGKG